MQHLENAYEPINELKPVTDDLWIVDGPTIRFGMPWPKLPFTTRMTLVRLQGGRLFVHSPTPLTPPLRDSIAKLGHPTWIIGPNRIHYWWIPEWHAAFPQAEVFLAPRIREQANGHIDFDAATLDATSGYPWDEEIATVAAPGSFMTEFDFFHRRSRTLILADLIENFEPEKLDSRWQRWLTQLAGADGHMPRDMRVTFRKHGDELRAAVETMIGWHPERIILAHGRWFTQRGDQELRRAFRWLLDS